MKNIKKALVGFLLGFIVLFTGCQEKVYTKEQLHVDMKSKMVYEKDAKTLANGSINFKKNNDEGLVILKDGLIQSMEGNHLGNKIKLEFKNKKTLMIDSGVNNKIEFFDNGDFKYIFEDKSETRTNNKFNKDEKTPYYISVEKKSDNKKIIYENDVFVISSLDTNKVIETFRKDDSKGKMMLENISNNMEMLKKSLHENMYMNALEVIK